LPAAAAGLPESGIQTRSKIMAHAGLIRTQRRPEHRRPEPAARAHRDHQRRAKPAATFGAIIRLYNAMGLITQEDRVSWLVARRDGGRSAQLLSA
jgi:hypothetical protein